MNVNATMLGLIVGAALGFAAAFGGLGAFAIVVVTSGLGLLVGRFLDGQLDLSALTNRDRGRRR